MKSSLEIAQDAELQPIERDRRASSGLEPEEIEPYGRYKARSRSSAIDRLADKPDAKLVCVAGMTPTKAGEGKTTTSVALTQGLGYIGRSPVLCLREPSLGPVFGMKGGAAGGGLAQVVPMEDLNLHFTGDIHAIGAANNLLAAILDASILHGNPHHIDALQVTWKRAVDMNDRALRQVALGLGGPANGYPRESGFDITAASEVMAILAVARDLQDLRRAAGRDHRRLHARRRARDGRGPRRRRRDGRAAQGRDQAQPDPDARGPALPDARGAVRQHRPRQLVADRRPAGPEAGRVRGHRVGLRLRHGDGEVHRHRLPRRRHRPDAVVLVVHRARAQAPRRPRPTTRDGPLPQAAGGDRGRDREPRAAPRRSSREFGLPAVVAVNRRPGGHRRGGRAGRPGSRPRRGLRAPRSATASRRAAKGVADLAETVVAACDQPNEFSFLYEDGATDQGEDRDDRRSGSTAPPRSSTTWRPRRRSSSSPTRGSPSCRCAWRRPRSRSRPTRRCSARPTGFQLPVRDLRAYTGAGWLVPLCGDIQQMPGLGKTRGRLRRRHRRRGPHRGPVLSAAG